jgi:hypothetical protein
MPEEPRSEIAELQREWRSSVSTSIGELERKIDLILIQMSDIRIEYARNHELRDVSKRVAQLESDRAKVIGAAVLLNAVGMAVLWLLGKFWK